MSLSGKVALITGASRGIGKCIALAFAKEGISVVLNYKSNDVGAMETIEEIKSFGGYAYDYKGDIKDYTFVSQMMEDVVKKFGKIDILVNNAGVSKVGLFVDMTEEDWDQLIDTNLKGVFNCCHNAMRHMLNQKNGNIINISSIWGEVGASCEVIYSSSKGGVNSFTRALAKELAPSNIRVNAISPGVIKTEMNQWLSPLEKEELINEIPMMRMGEGEDIGNLAVFLAKDSSKYITGQIITVDGGML